jgi:hypothetical protein
METLFNVSGGGCYAGERPKFTGKPAAPPLSARVGRGCPVPPAAAWRAKAAAGFDIQRRVGGHRQDWLSVLQALQRSDAERVEEESWVLEPVGDGTTKHLANRAGALPGTFRLSTDAATVGRLAGKADIVIPIATVSGLHARLERGEGNIMFVTDLGSTNGTYIDSRKIKPRTVTPVSNGSRITFGDQHLASFRLSKLEVVHA